jgi:hypothetical protein
VSDYGLDDRAIGARSPAGENDFSPRAGRPGDRGSIPGRGK